MGEKQNNSCHVKTGYLFHQHHSAAPLPSIQHFLCFCVCVHFILATGNCKFCVMVSFILLSFVKEDLFHVQKKKRKKDLYIHDLICTFYELFDHLVHSRYSF